MAKRYKISNIRSGHRTAELRIISAERPYEDALPAVPVLEDVFLYYFGEMGGGENAVV